jgi:hypothetical protein
MEVRSRRHSVDLGSTSSSDKVNNGAPSRDEAPDKQKLMEQVKSSLFLLKKRIHKQNSVEGNMSNVGGEVMLPIKLNNVVKADVSSMESVGRS